MKTRLPDSELEVMQVIWRHEGAMHTGDVMRAMPAYPKVTLQSVQNYLSRLVDKGYLRIDKRGRLNYYTASVLREDYRKLETDSFIGKHYDNSPFRLVAHLVKDKGLSRSEAEELRRILRESEGSDGEDTD